MDKLNNEELNNVSAGVNGQEAPGLEWMELYLHNHGGHCKNCGTPVTEFQPFLGPVKAGKFYEYTFLCKCPSSPLNYRTLLWDSETGNVDIPGSIVQ